MKAATSAFDGALSNWKEHLETPWAHLHFRVSQANLRRHLPRSGEPLRILDAGGGSGAYALAYAGQGHAVTLVDVSGEMLGEARRNAEAAGVVAQISFHQGELAALPELFPDPVFDLVLCHNVVQYTADAASSVQSICHPLRCGGLLSLISVNRYSEAFRGVLLWLDPSTALEKLEATTSHSGVFGKSMQLHTASELTHLIESAGCSVLAQYGIRCVNDYIPDNDLKSDPDFYAQLERLELAMSGRYPYYLVARFFQIIARKTAPEDEPS